MKARGELVNNSLDTRCKRGIARMCHAAACALVSLEAV